MSDVARSLQETLKSVIAQYNASQLITMREVSTCHPAKQRFSSLHASSILHSNTLMICRLQDTMHLSSIESSAIGLAICKGKFSRIGRKSSKEGLTSKLTLLCQNYSAKLDLLHTLQVVSRDIRRVLTQRANAFNIVLDDVSITQLTFGREYTHAIEAKQVAQQEAERAKFIVSC